MIGVVCYTLLAYGISWALWLPLAVAGGAPADSPLRYLHLLGGIGPAAAAVLVARLFYNPPAFNRLGKRIVAWRVGFPWHLIAWASPFALLAVSQAIVLVAVPDGETVRLGRSSEYPLLPAPLYWAASVVGYGFGEEIGWRGFLLPRLQAKLTAFRATLVLSIVWAGWHVPLFWFTPGMSQMGIGEIVGWYASIVTGSLLFTWLFNTTGGSVLIVAVFHGTMDIAFLASGPPVLPMVIGAMITIWGIGIIFKYGPADLSPRPRVTDF